MLAVSHPTFPALPSSHLGDMDESGTINPAALNTSCKLPSPECGCDARRQTLPCRARLNARKWKLNAIALTDECPCSVHHRTEPLVPADTTRCEAESITG